MNDNPTGVGATISLAIKTVLVALIAVGALPWTDTQVSAVGLAIAAVVDLTIYLGLIRPRVTPLTNPKTANGTPLIPDTTTNR